MSDDVDSGSDSPDDAPSADDGPIRRRPFALLLIAILTVWKIHDAVVAETVRATLAPSLYLLGLGAFAASLLGARSLQLLTFFAGAVLCLAAIAYEVGP